MNSASISLQLKAGDIEIVDPQDVLKNCILFFAFPRSKSANFPIALSLAQAATAYGEQDILGRTLYWAGFTNSINDLEKGAELLRLAGNWVGTQAKVSGTKIRNSFNAYLTISCYLNALKCSSQPAHCHKIIDDPFHPNYEVFSQTVKRSLSPWYSKPIEFHEKIKQYNFPCKRMLEHSSFHPQFNFKKVYKVTPEEQIQAAAVDYGISICPFFDANSFKDIEVKDILVEGSIDSTLTTKNIND